MIRARVGRGGGILSICILALCGCVDNPSPTTLFSNTTGERIGPDADGGPAENTDASHDVPSHDTGPDAAIDMPAELLADPGANVAADIDAFVLLDGSGSIGAVRYQWSFGNGEGWDEPRETPNATVQYDEAGRYQAVLTVFDEAGDSRSASKVVTITHPAVFEPSQSSTVAVIDEEGRVAVVSPDSNELMIAEPDRADYDVEDRLMTDRGPRAVTIFEDWMVVPCERDATVLFFRTNATGELRRVFLPAASRPFGAAGSDGAVFVTLQAKGSVARIEFTDGVPSVTKTAAVIHDPRHISRLPDGRLLVSRFRSPDERGEVAVVTPDLETVEIWPLAVDPQPASDTEIGGLPTYLGAVAVSPTGLEAAVPSLQANIEQGQYLNGEPLTHEHTVRAVASFFDLESGAEQFERRKQWDDRGFANAAVFSSRGDFLYVAMRGNRAVERYDMLASNESGTLLEIGHTIEGLALSRDDRLLFVDAALSRELVIYDVSDLGAVAEPLERLQIPTSEPLDDELLRGKRLFNDAQDRRITKDGYIACAHCHLDGESDRRVWDFTDRGEGLRNTTSLVGRAGTGHGPVHWSANFDEIQDFENDIRGAFGGTGLMDDADYFSGTRAEPLGDPKAGISEDLDALAAYVTSLERPLPSPYRTASGGLTVEAQAGELLFDSQGCADCHVEPRFTDSQFLPLGEPLLHDVGTLGPGSGQRLGGPLVGIDTPTLRGVWNSPPYLHDGSAATLLDVLTTKNPDDAHGTTSTLTPQQLDELVTYLNSIDHH